MKVRELLKLQVDVDVCNDYADEFYDENGRSFVAEIAFCGPQKLTEEGEKHYARVLDFDVDVDESTACVHIPEVDQEQIEKDSSMAMMLFYGAAGHVPESEYKRYFKDE